MLDLEDISLAGELACLLEVSATPKPGNVHRFSNFIDLTYEDFLFSSVALGKALRRINYGEKFGEALLKSVRILKSLCKAGNTHFGTLVLFIPITLVSFSLLKNFGKLEKKEIRKGLKDFVKNTDVEDSVNFFLAILEAKVGGLGKLKDKSMPDLSEKDWKDKILSRKLDLYSIMSYSSKYDLVAKEFYTGFSISFNLGLKSLNKYFNEYKDINLAIVHSFLEILSKYPDTFIARKLAVRKYEYLEDGFEEGMRVAKKYSKRAKEILELGGLTTKEGIKALIDMDEELRKKNLNPGSVADIIASSIFLALLFGWGR
ncbi:2-(5''-triphosphoribosyl)-3'-dephosphocoenzyme-A synthase [archaeon HR06]|nr:2-(5''-triphosphoribosyl)-3'-dephosphocoenzyme-A synthase [archaeon HR06]